MLPASDMLPGSERCVHAARAICLQPAPDVYNLAAANMGLSKSECVVIEDSGIGCKVWE